ncbi:MAG: hypothetical protein ACYTGN_02975 [Planctomycetota bacterium]
MKTLAVLLVVAAITVIGIAVLFVVPISRYFENRLPRKVRKMREKQAAARRNQHEA